MPDQVLSRDFRTQITGTRPHIAVGQLEPGPGKSIGEFFRILQVTPGNRVVNRIKTQGKVGCGHHRRVAFSRIVRILNSVRRCRICRNPLESAGRTFNDIPVIFEQSLQIAHIVFSWVWLPGTFQAAADRIAALAAPETALPAKTLLLDGRTLRFSTDMRSRPGAMTLAEGMAAGNERNGLFVIHGHAGKSRADVTAGSNCVGHTVRAFRIYIDQAHLDCSQRVFKITFTGIAVITQPFVLGAPVNVLLRFPDIRAAAAKPEGLETH